MKRQPTRATRAVRRMALAPIFLYQRVSPAFPRRCRYEPTCSRYAVDAVRELGLIRGALLATWRVLRCNPWSPGGVDPLSDRRLFRARRPDGPGAGADAAPGAGS